MANKPVRMDVSHTDIYSASPTFILSQERLASLGALDIGEALRYVPGVQLKDYGGVGGLKTVSYRSLGSSHTAVLLDENIQLNNQTGSMYSLVPVDLTTSFSLLFKVNFGCDDFGGEGMAFVLQPGVWATGSGGNGLGAQALTKPVAGEFDTYRFDLQRITSILGTEPVANVSEYFVPNIGLVKQDINIGILRRSLILVNYSD